MFRLSVHLVTWNGAKYIPGLFDSLRQQTFRDWQLLILDNGSTDGTVAAVEKELAGDWCRYQMFKSEKNLGFAGGHNQLYHVTCNTKHVTSDFVLVLNQDIVLEPDYFEKLVDFMDTHPEAASASGRIMQMRDKTKIDSLGLKVFRNRRVVDLGAGVQVFKCSSVQGTEVFGVSGVAPIYRCQALEKVGFFDENFFSYKEDVDLAFRLRNAGWKAFCVFGAVAYHDRAGEGARDLSDWSAAKNKQHQSSLVKYHSYKNHLMILYKNEYRQNFLLDFPWIFWYELKKFVYFLFFDRVFLKGWQEIWQMRKKLKDKRGEISKKRKIEWREMRRWWDS